MQKSFSFLVRLDPKKSMDELKKSNKYLLVNNVPCHHEMQPFYQLFDKSRVILPHDCVRVRTW